MSEGNDEDNDNNNDEGTEDPGDIDQILIDSVAPNACLLWEALPRTLPKGSAPLWQGRRRSRQRRRRRRSRGPPIVSTAGSDECASDVAGDHSRHGLPRRTEGRRRRCRPIGAVLTISAVAANTLRTARHGAIEHCQVNHPDVERGAAGGVAVFTTGHCAGRCGRAGECGHVRCGRRQWQ